MPLKGEKKKKKTLLKFNFFFFKKALSSRKNMSKPAWNPLHHFQQKRKKTRVTRPDHELLTHKLKNTVGRSPEPPQLFLRHGGSVHRKPPNSLNYLFSYINYSSPGLAQPIFSFPFHL